MDRLAATFATTWLITSLLCGCSIGASTPAPPDTLAPLAPITGSALQGQQVFAQREAGHCVLCHQIDGLDAEFQGNLGPPLSDVGARLSAAQIRYRIVDAAALNPNTIMPPYFRTTGLNQVDTRYQGQTALSAEQIEHLVAYLTTLTGAR